MTDRAEDRLPVAEVDPVPARFEEDGEAWVLVTSCRGCGAGLRKATPELPTGWARKIALALGGLMVCSSCAAKDEAEYERKERAAVVKERFRESGLPAAARELEWSAMVASGERARAIEAAKLWASAAPGDARGVLLHGPVGTGKTRLAATAAWQRLQRWPLRWVSVAVLVSQLQASFSDDERRQALRVLTGTGALVLDDFDKVKPSEQVLSQLFTAVDRRVEARAPLLITTNLRSKELVDRFGEAITSRLLGYCLGRVHVMSGPDRRMKLDGAE